MSLDPYLPVSAVKHLAAAGAVHEAFAIERPDGEWELALAVGAERELCRVRTTKRCAARTWAGPDRVLGFAKLMGLWRVTFQIRGQDRQNGAEDQLPLFDLQGDDAAAAA
jgi:hypothetical protein